MGHEIRSITAKGAILLAFSCVLILGCREAAKETTVGAIEGVAEAVATTDSDFHKLIGRWNVTWVVYDNNEEEPTLTLIGVMTFNEDGTLKVVDADGKEENDKFAIADQTLTIHMEKGDLTSLFGKIEWNNRSEIRWFVSLLDPSPGFEITREYFMLRRI